MQRWGSTFGSQASVPAAQKAGIPSRGGARRFGSDISNSHGVRSGYGAPAGKAALKKPTRTSTVGSSGLALFAATEG